MLFRALFTQYQTGKGILFGSKLLNVLGRIFFGTPESNGLAEDEVRADLRKSYYYIQRDRFMPTGGDDLKEWQKHSILVNQFRVLEGPSNAFKVVIGQWVCIAIICLVVSLTSGAWSFGKSASHGLASMLHTSSSSFTVSKKDCDGLRLSAQNNMIDIDDPTNLEHIKSCRSAGL